MLKRREIQWGEFSSDVDAEGTECFSLSSPTWLSPERMWASSLTPLPSHRSSVCRNPFSKALALCGLHKRFGNTVAVEHLDLEIESGEVFGFLGPNGAGKSTTVQMLCGLLSPCGGDILIYGRSLRAHPEMRTQIGICPQQLVIWDKMTPLEQLMFMASTYQIPAKRARALALLLLEQMGLWDKKDTLAKLLSGGMKRRLNLLMALMHEPSILVLDEPEAGLDPQSRILVREYIRSWAREGRRTVLLTSHNMDEVERLADRIGIMDRGALLVQGTSQQLKAKVGQEETCSIQVVDTSCSRVQRALQFLERLLLTPQVLSDRLCFSMQKPAQMLPQVLEVLQHCEVHIRGLQMHTPTLEDVFLALTGRRLREPS